MLTPMTSLPTIQAIYTDGACSGNPGPGGWGTVVYFANGTRHELGGRDPQTTNNRMEMQAAIAALEYLAETNYPHPVELHTDSEYLKNGITQWIKGWKKKDWKTSAGKPVLNQDLWQVLDRLNRPKVSWKYVRGHAGNEGNERCDAIARAFAQGQQPSLVRQGLQTQNTDGTSTDTVQSNLVVLESLHLSASMTDVPPPATHEPTDESLPRDVRVTQLRQMVDTLHMADEIAQKGYLITSSELADLMDINAGAVTSRGDHWVWRNWIVSRVRREGNQILWQLERVDQPS